MLHSEATSSRRSPLVRRRCPRGRPTSSGCNASRLLRRNPASPVRSITLLTFRFRALRRSYRLWAEVVTVCQSPSTSKPVVSSACDRKVLDRPVPALEVRGPATLISEPKFMRTQGAHPIHVPNREPPNLPGRRVLGGWSSERVRPLPSGLRCISQPSACSWRRSRRKPASGAPRSPSPGRHPHRQCGLAACVRLNGRDGNVSLGHHDHDVRTRSSRTTRSWAAGERGPCRGPGRQPRTARPHDPGGFHTRQFWGIAVGLSMVGVVVYDLQVHLVPMMTDRGLSADQAGSLLVIFGLGDETPARAFHEYYARPSRQLTIHMFELARSRGQIPEHMKVASLADQLWGACSQGHALRGVARQRICRYVGKQPLRDGCQRLNVNVVLGTDDRQRRQRLM